MILFSEHKCNISYSVLKPQCCSPAIRFSSNNSTATGGYWSHVKTASSSCASCTRPCPFATLEVKTAATWGAWGQSTGQTRGAAMAAAHYNCPWSLSVLQVCNIIGIFLPQLSTRCVRSCNPDPPRVSWGRSCLECEARGWNGKCASAMQLNQIRSQQYWAFEDLTPDLSCIFCALWAGKNPPGQGS